MFTCQRRRGNDTRVEPSDTSVWQVSTSSAGVRSLDNPLPLSCRPSLASELICWWDQFGKAANYRTRVKFNPRGPARTLGEILSLLDLSPMVQGAAPYLSVAVLNLAVPVVIQLSQPSV